MHRLTRRPVPAQVKPAIETRQPATQLSSLHAMQRQQITFIGNRRKSIAILAVAAGVCVLGVCALLLAHPLVGIVLIVAALAPVLVSLPVVVSPRSRYLHLDPNGFEVRVRRDRVRIEWADVTEFRWGSHHGSAVIEVGYAEPTGHEPHTARIFNRYNAPLPYVMGKLVEWRLRYAPQR